MNIPVFDENQSIEPELPSVSIIVLNFNTREHLEPCFVSLQQLIYPQEKLEFIMVDNASTDDSVEYTQTNFPSINIIQNDENYGFSIGNNIGARKAQGDFIAFLNPDMRVDKRWLIEAIDPLLKNSDVAAVGSKILSWNGKHIDFAGGMANFYGYGYQIGLGYEAIEAFDEVKPILFACGGAMIIRRQVFLDCKGFDEDYFAYYEDVDLGWRLWVLGYKVLFIPTSITYHIHHGSWQKVNEGKRRVLYERNAFFTMFKNYEENHLTKILPVALLLMLKRIHLATGVDDKLFRIGKIPQIPNSASIDWKSPHSKNYTSKYYLAKMWHTLKAGGISSLYHSIKAELTRRCAARLQNQAPEKMVLKEDDPHKAMIPLQALSYIVAGNDIITLLPKILDKRETIQNQRRRSDQEIFQIMGNPFGSSEAWSEYKHTQDYLTHLFKIDTFF